MTHESSTLKCCGWCSMYSVEATDNLVELYQSATKDPTSRYFTKLADDDGLDFICDQLCQSYLFFLFFLFLIFRFCLTKKKVCDYLNDTANVLSSDEAYSRSLNLEPRLSVVANNINSFESNCWQDRLFPMQIMMYLVSVSLLKLKKSINNPKHATVTYIVWL